MFRIPATISVVTVWISSAEKQYTQNYRWSEAERVYIDCLEDKKTPDAEKKLCESFGGEYASGGKATLRWFVGFFTQVLSSTPDVRCVTKCCLPKTCQVAVSPRVVEVTDQQTSLIVRSNEPPTVHVNDQDVHKISEEIKNKILEQLLNDEFVAYRVKKDHPEEEMQKALLNMLNDPSSTSFDVRVYIGTKVQGKSYQDLVQKVLKQGKLLRELAQTLEKQMAAAVTPRERRLQIDSVALEGHLFNIQNAVVRTVFDENSPVQNKIVNILTSKPIGNMLDDENFLEEKAVEVISVIAVRMLQIFQDEFDNIVQGIKYAYEEVVDGIEDYLQSENSKQRQCHFPFYKSECVN